jgi:hypothetical protein
MEMAGDARVGTVLLAGAILLLAGCAGSLNHTRDKVVADLPRIERELSLKSAWNGRSYSALVATYGPPQLIMGIPGNRPNEAIAVYGVRDNTSRCIDAFTLVRDEDRSRTTNEPTVTNYFCR